MHVHEADLAVGVVNAIHLHAPPVNGQFLAQGDTQVQSTLLTIKNPISGNAGSATKLATARTFRVNLASTSTASFDGAANVTPGVTGTLPIANGGTGGSTEDEALHNLGAAALTSTISIPDNSNLNDYIDIGTYRVGVAATAKTIANTPITTSGYMLNVYRPYGRNSTSFVTQIATTYYGATYVRYYTGSSNTWSNWEQRKSGARFKPQKI